MYSLVSCLHVYVKAHRGVLSTVQVVAEETSLWFHCEATNKLGKAETQTEFYVSGTVHYM